MVNRREISDIIKKIQRDEPIDKAYPNPEPSSKEGDSNMLNVLLGKNSSTILDNRHASIKISDNRRPVYGILTEPIRGRIRNIKNDKETFDHDKDEVSYIPKAHVQFLEQSGIVVIPISYLLSEAEIKDELRQVNGIYICGDSERSVANKKYQEAFDVIMDFVVESNREEKQYFPMFMMGKSAQSFIVKLGLSSSALQNMRKYRN